ncbi:MAG: class I SAM-dependent methyltransferase [Planctomycetes bacterium]|nr:class I SAM-dependent methyltransferase [Planctomycetota bacterium]
MRVGRLVAGQLAAALQLFRAPAVHPLYVLDFGCGCGRIARYLSVLPGLSLVGCDIDREAITWAGSHLSHAMSPLLGSDEPPLPLADRSFHVVYAVSVFTHLPEPLALAWLQELHRITRSDGYLLLTTHGRAELPWHALLSRLRLALFGFAHRRGRYTPGLPAYYHSSYHTPQYLHRVTAPLFRVLTIHSRAINNHQDLIVLQPTTQATVTGSLARAEPRPG